MWFFCNAILNMRFKNVLFLIYHLRNWIPRTNNAFFRKIVPESFQHVCPLKLFGILAHILSPISSCWASMIRSFLSSEKKKRFVTKNQVSLHPSDTFAVCKLHTKTVNFVYKNHVCNTYFDSYKYLIITLET